METDVYQTTQLVTELIEEQLMVPPRVSPRRPKWILYIALLVVALGVYFGARYVYGDAAVTDSSPHKETHPAIPVSVAQVQRADFPVYLNGLGTVQPYEIVTLNSRVDGEITKIEFKQGQMVKKGDILAEIDPRPYAAALGMAVAKKAQDQASLTNAQINLRRYTTLEGNAFASRKQLDTQQAAVDELIAQIAGDQAAIDNAQTQVSYTTIRSPIDGKAGFRLVDPGNIVHATSSTGIVTIVRLQPISVVFTAPEQDIPQINKALATADVPVAALSSDGLTTLSQGKLAIVNNAVDQTSGTISMKATFANTDDALWPGLSVTTRLLVETLKQVIVVPDDALQHGPDGQYVYVVGAGNKVEMRAVEIDQSDGGVTVVRHGVSPGDSVVTAGQYSLTTGAIIQPTVSIRATPAPSAQVP